MLRNFMQRNSAALLCVILAVLPLLVACDGATAGSQPEGQTVKVSVNDQRIELPTSLKAGLTTFTVTNNGTAVHSFGITGPAGDVTLQQMLAPGETANLKVSLDTGTYRVYSPEPNSAATMQVALVVRPEPPHEGKG